MWLFINHRDIYHPKAGGAEQVLYEILKRFPINTYWLSEKVKGKPSYEQLDNIKFIRKGGKVSLHLYSPLYAKKAEVVVDSVAHAVPFFSYLVNKNAIALVHHVHQQVVKYELNPILAELVKTAEKRLKSYKHLISVSNTTKQDLIKLGIESEKIQVIYNGIDHEKFYPGVKSDVPMIFWIGRMMKYKNPLDIIEIKRKTKSKVKFVVAGTGELSEEFKILANKEGIKYLGRISEKEKVKLLQSSWMILSTSFIEGWGMTIVEANACGTPALGYNTGSIPEVIKPEKNGFLVNYKDFEMAAKIIDYISEDENIMKELSNSSYISSLQYDWNKTSKQYFDYIVSAVK
ncbi:glycosyltransferase family 4 protein [Candidatus Acidianus copahuensis]|uniref:Glycosyl transferase n=1 Tax=Candidatus Acidianus copahuensis TaxID=1160895 RepID=A0A031LL13_9CREN|nr:glycosyl transferase [Candidatus Acidianus copahuensis]